MIFSQRKNMYELESFFTFALAGRRCARIHRHLHSAEPKLDSYYYVIDIQHFVSFRRPDRLLSVLLPIDNMKASDFSLGPNYTGALVSFCRVARVPTPPQSAHEAPRSLRKEQAVTSSASRRRPSRQCAPRDSQVTSASSSHLQYSLFFMVLNLRVLLKSISN